MLNKFVVKFLKYYHIFTCSNISNNLLVVNPKALRGIDNEIIIKNWRINQCKLMELHLKAWRCLKTNLLPMVRNDNLSFKYMIWDIEQLAYNLVSFCHALHDVKVDATNEITIVKREREAKITWNINQFWWILEV